MAKRVHKMAIRCLLFDYYMSTPSRQVVVCQRFGEALSIICLHIMHIFACFCLKTAVLDSMSLKCLHSVLTWQQGPLQKYNSLCHSELSRILTCIFQSMMPHLHTLLGRQSRWLHYGYIMAIVRQHRLLADFRKPDKFANV